MKKLNLLTASAHTPNLHSYNLLSPPFKCTSSRFSLAHQPHQKTRHAIHVAHPSCAHRNHPCASRCPSRLSQGLHRLQARHQIRHRTEDANRRCHTRSVSVYQEPQYHDLLNTCLVDNLSPPSPTNNGTSKPTKPRSSSPTRHCVWTPDRNLAGKIWRISTCGSVRTRRSRRSGMLWLMAGLRWRLRPGHVSLMLGH
jgi:hypothetical protein